MAALVMWLGLLARARLIRSSIEADKKQSPYSLEQLRTALQRLRVFYRMLMFPLCAAYALQTLLAAFISNLRTPITTKTFPLELNSSSLLLSVTILAIIFGIELLDLFVVEKADLNVGTEGVCAELGVRMRGVEGGKKWYVSLFLMRWALMGLLVEWGLRVGHSDVILLMGAVMFLYLMTIVVGRPYRQGLHWIGVLVN